MQTLRFGDFLWHIEAQHRGDFWFDAQGGPDGSPALIGRAFPGREGRWVSQPIDVEPGKAYLFSLLVRSQLNRAQGRLELLFLDNKGEEKARFYSRTAFRQHDWTLYKAVGIAPQGTSQALLCFAVFGPEDNSSGEARIAQPRLEQTVAIKAQLTAKGNILLHPAQGTFSLSLLGVSQELPLNVSWQLLDFDLKTLAESEVALKSGEHLLPLPKLEPGYYTLRVRVEGKEIFPNEEEISFGVITPLPENFNRKASPICLDAGMSWSYAPDEERLDLACYLCEIAGIGLLRDRLSWSEVENEEGKFAWGRYAQAAEAQARHKITVYQIFHDCPAWASVELIGGRKASNQPPRDPIYIYRMVNRLVKYLGRYVRYFEVWNEPNIGFFNGRPEDYAAILKAAYLGAKDADPRFGVLIGSAAGTPGEFYERVYQNDVGGYFDIYNQHWYGLPEELFNFLPNEVIPQLKRYGLDGKPVWMTEMGMAAYPDEKGDFKEVERQQASYLVRAYASSFANAVSRFFYFYLCEFLEGSISLWGIVRSDLTPKPTYIALANLIRQLGEAKCLGWKRIDDSYIVAFKKDTKENVLIVWGKEGEKIALPAKGPIVDIVGRMIQKEETRTTLRSINLSNMPVYVRGVSERDIQGLRLQPPLAAMDWQPVPDSQLARKRVWLQLEVEPTKPRSGDENERWGAFIEPEKPFVLRAWVNNYSDEPAIASLTCQPDEMFVLQGEGKVKLEVSPWQRGFHDFLIVGRNIIQGQKMGVSVLLETEKHKEEGRVYLQSRSSDVRAKEERVIMDGGSGVDLLVKNNSPTTELLLASDPSLEFAGQPSLRVETTIINTGDAWAFPIIRLPGDLDLGSFKGLEVWSYVEKGEERNSQLQLQLVEEDGGTYILPPLRSLREDGWRRDIALLSAAQPTPWGPDPDGRLELSKVRTILLGWGGYTSGRVGEKVVFWVGKLSAISW